MKQIDSLVQESFSLCFLELSGCSLGDEGFQLLVGDQDQRRAGPATNSVRCSCISVLEVPIMGSLRFLGTRTAEVTRRLQSKTLMSPTCHGHVTCEASVTMASHLEAELCLQRCRGQTGFVSRYERMMRVYESLL